MRLVQHSSLLLLLLTLAFSLLYSDQNYYCNAAAIAHDGQLTAVKSSLKPDALDTVVGLASYSSSNSSDGIHYSRVGLTRAAERTTLAVAVSVAALRACVATLTLIDPGKSRFLNFIKGVDGGSFGVVQLLGYYQFIAVVLNVQIESGAEIITPFAKSFAWSTYVVPKLSKSLFATSSDGWEDEPEMNSYLLTQTIGPNVLLAVLVNIVLLVAAIFAIVTLIIVSFKVARVSKALYTREGSLRVRATIWARLYESAYVPLTASTVFQLSTESGSSAVVKILAIFILVTLIVYLPVRTLLYRWKMGVLRQGAGDVDFEPGFQSIHDRRHHFVRALYQEFTDTSFSFPTITYLRLFSTGLTIGLVCLSNLVQVVLLLVVELFSIIFYLRQSPFKSRVFAIDYLCHSVAKIASLVILTVLVGLQDAPQETRDALSWTFVAISAAVVLINPLSVLLSAIVRGGRSAYEASHENTEKILAGPLRRKFADLTAPNELQAPLDLKGKGSESVDTLYSAEASGDRRDALLTNFTGVCREALIQEINRGIEQVSLTVPEQVTSLQLHTCEGDDLFETNSLASLPMAHIEDRRSWYNNFRSRICEMFSPKLAIDKYGANSVAENKSSPIEKFDDTRNDDPGLENVLQAYRQHSMEVSPLSKSLTTAFSFGLTGTLRWQIDKSHKSMSKTSVLLP